MTQRQDLHERLRRRDEIKGSSDRAFGFVFAAVFALIGLWPLLGGGGARLWTLVVAAVFLGAAVARPRVLAPLNRLWMRLGLLLHRVVNPLILGLLFFLTVTPMGVAVRLFGRDLLRLRWDPEAPSYWIERRPPGPAPETMKHQF